VRKNVKSRKFLKISTGILFLKLHISLHDGHTTETCSIQWWI